MAEPVSGPDGPNIGTADRVSGGAGWCPVGGQYAPIASCWHPPIARRPPPPRRDNVPVRWRTRCNREYSQRRWFQRGVRA
jgi:hypothetical protein